MKYIFSYIVIIYMIEKSIEILIKNVFYLVSILFNITNELNFGKEK